MAVATKILSPLTTGEADPLPGISTFHLRFFDSPHSTGGRPSRETPFPVGPRQWGQSLSAAGSTPGRRRESAAVRAAESDAA
jgi:hypothetical protein